MAGAIAQGRQRCQSPFVLDEKSTVVPVGSPRERSGGARKVSWRRSFELRASGAVGLRWQAVFGSQIVWNKSTRCGGGRVRGPVLLRTDRPAK
jgi:hypothetical protein